MAVNEKVSNVYAEALFELSEKDAESVEQELLDLVELLQSDPSLWKFFSAPVIPETEKLAVIQKAIKPEVSQILYHFLGVLTMKSRLDELPRIARAYSAMLDESLGRKKITVYSAIDLGSSEQTEIQNALKTYFDKKIIMTVYTKPEIIGGLIIDSGDTVIDSSLLSSLKRIQSKLLTRKILGEEFYEN